MSITPDVLLRFFALLSPVTHGGKKSPNASGRRPIL
jgi:hypothetical protein